jgi:hypothetical protein
MSDSIYRYQSVSLSPSLVIAFIFLNIAMDIQHLKHFPVTSGEMRCHAIAIHID